MAKGINSQLCGLPCGVGDPRGMVRWWNHPGISNSKYLDEYSYSRNRSSGDPTKDSARSQRVYSSLLSLFFRESHWNSQLRWSKGTRHSEGCVTNTSEAQGSPDLMTSPTHRSTLTSASSLLTTLCSNTDGGDARNGVARFLPHNCQVCGVIAAVYPFLKRSRPPTAHSLFCLQSCVSVRILTPKTG